MGKLWKHKGHSTFIIDEEVVGGISQQLDEVEGTDGSGKGLVTTLEVEGPDVVGKADTWCWTNSSSVSALGNRLSSDSSESDSSMTHRKSFNLLFTRGTRHNLICE